MASPASTTPATTHELLAIWDALALHLDIHAEAEETILYPHLVKHGDDGEDETADAIGDHNKIRDAIAESKLHPVGSDAVVGGGLAAPAGRTASTWPRRRTRRCPTSAGTPAPSCGPSWASAG